jgi:ABC-type glycerol-3-phosphate transport system permease component
MNNLNPPSGGSHVGGSRRRWQQWGINALLSLICAIMIFPIFTTLVISFKQEADVVRKPPIFFP